MKIVTSLREAVKQNVKASGMIEIRGEREVLLDDFVQAADDTDGKRRTKCEEPTGLDDRLRASGESLRNYAMARRGERSNPTGVNPPLGKGFGLSTPMEKAKRKLIHISGHIR